MYLSIREDWRKRVLEEFSKPLLPINSVGKRSVTSSLTPNRSRIVLSYSVCVRRRINSKPGLSIVEKSKFSMSFRNRSNILVLAATVGCGAPGGGILPTSSALITRRQVSRFFTKGASRIKEVKFIPAVCVSGPWQAAQFSANRGSSS